ncbi:MAG TPA: hypothetical protein VJ979_03545 [Actinomycetota bacterium]|nr:hypothetical protein [Actinomycetota bacterium]
MTRRASPRTIAIAVCLVLGLVATMAVIAGRDTGSEVAEPLVRPDPVTGPFEGLGVWVDIYDEEAWGDPAGTIETMVANGARTLYLQSSNADRDVAFVHPDETAALLEAAHDRGVAVIAWYLPHLTDLDRDRDRARAAIAFASPRGDRFDGFALDIESPAVRDPLRRSERLIRLSGRLRAIAGDRYPLGAIVPSPVRLVDDAAYWPGFPWGALARTYDAVLPMTYFTFRVAGPAETVTYVTRAVQEIRAGIGSDDVPIHVIGGLARDMTVPETRAFVRAVRASGTIGASTYTLPFVTPEQWAILGRV